MLGSFRRLSFRISHSISIRRANHFDSHYLRKNPANYVPLSPLSLLNRSVEIYPTTIAYVFNDQTVSWALLHERVCRFASALRKMGIKKHDVVSVLASNTPLAFQSHFGVLGAKAVLHTINVRLDAVQIAFQLRHAQTKVLLVDEDHWHLALDAVNLIQPPSRPTLFLSRHGPEDVQVDMKSSNVSVTDFEHFLLSGDSHEELLLPDDEWDACCVNYTSGTTGDPKGVVYHHRGAYLNALSNIIEFGLRTHDSFLWVVPMFHCNGWCFPWALAAVAGTSYLMKQVRPEVIFDLTSRFKVQVICGAPITMNTLLDYRGPGKTKFGHKVKMFVGGSPPPTLTMQLMQSELNVHVQTLYGLTETYGPSTSHRMDPTWNLGSDSDEAFNRSIIQQANIGTASVTVRDPVTLFEIPADGSTRGEVMFRGNNVMKGYLGNESATLAAFEGGWFRTGDLAVRHPNGRFELKDRSKDIIISGGENISAVEVESIFVRHNAVREAALVGMPDERWGEVGCLFITLRPHIPIEEIPSQQSLLEWGRKRMAGFQTPKKVVVLEELPKTATGKIQKHVLRKMAA